MRKSLWIIAFIASFSLFLLSFSGSIHPVGDSLAVFRPGLSVLPVLLAFLIRRGWLVGLGVVALILGLTPYFLGKIPGQPASEPTLRLYQKNLSFRLGDTSGLAQDIAESSANLTTFQEVTRANLTFLQGLSDQFAHIHYCPFATVGGVAVMSDLPVVEGSQQCAERDGLAAMQIETDRGPVWLVSIHLHWPYPHGQAQQADRLLELLESLEGPMLIGGDFNMVASSHLLRRFKAVTGTYRPGPVHTSFHLRRWIPFSIDHVLTPTTLEGEVSRREKLGSDHYGLLLEAGWVN